MKSKLLLAVVAAFMAVPAQAKFKGKEEAAKDRARTEKPLAERFREKAPETAPGSKAGKVLKGNGVKFEPLAAEVKGIYKAEGMDLEIPLNMQTNQGLRLSVNRAIVEDAVAEATKAKKPQSEIAQKRETYSGRTVTAMFREVKQARESLELARQLGAKDGVDGELLTKAEEMYREGAKLFNIAMSRYNEVASDAKTRDPLKDPSVAPLLSQLARMMSFGSARLREVLEESLREGDVAALSGFTVRAREFGEAASRSSVDNPMQEAFINILRQQGLEFADRNEMLKEANRMVKNQGEFCR